jgi:putative peptidoglycan lipid II flippase
LLLKNRFFGVIVSATGVSLVVQLLAFVRQVLIAAWFGVGRDVDIYVMAYALATFVVFTFAAIFDSIAVPHLVRRREEQGDGAALALAQGIARLSVVIGIGSIALLVIAAFLLAPVIATGFAPAEREALVNFVWYFLPWTLVCLPYYAAAAWHKARWRFSRAFAAEIMVVAVSIAALAIWHDDIRVVPLAYAAGYGAGLLQLSFGSGLWRRGTSHPATSLRAVLRNIGELYLANQSGSVSTLVDRHVQSFVPAGGLAAVNYAAQLVNSLASLLMFREIFVVPLARQEERSARLERLICGLVLVAVPTCAVVICFAPEVVKVLFERGRFDAAATALTGAILRISALSIVIGAINTPLARMFQIVDRIHYTHVMYLSLAIALACFGYLFVGVLDMGVRGVAWMQVMGLAVETMVTAYLVSRCDLHLRWRRVAGYAAFALVASAAASFVALLAASSFNDAWMRLLCGGAGFGLVMVGFYLLARSHLHGIAFGLATSKGESI